MPSRSAAPPRRLQHAAAVLRRPVEEDEQWDGAAGRRGRNLDDTVAFSAGEVEPAALEGGLRAGARTRREPAFAGLHRARRATRGAEREGDERGSPADAELPARGPHREIRNWNLEFGMLWAGRIPNS